MDFLKKFSFGSIIILLIISFNYSCADTGENENTPLPQFIQMGEATRSFDNVDERLWVYFERFENAGIARGMNINLENALVTGSISSDPGHDSAGACDTDSGGTMHHVSIREDFWETASPTDRAIIVYHELGHCFLDRGHVNTVSDDGICLSLMRAGGTLCIDNYFVHTRKFYLDELFEL